MGTKTFELKKMPRWCFGKNQYASLNSLFKRFYAKIKAV